MKWLPIAITRPMTRRSAVFLLIAVAVDLPVVTLACRKKARTGRTPGIGATQTGVASWYGHPYHGRRAANGEIYDMEKLTAAHCTLAFGTWVQVGT
jgi:rare lipoprotein A (peptidoglycan hydrolase)